MVNPSKNTLKCFNWFYLLKIFTVIILCTGFYKEQDLTKHFSCIHFTLPLTSLLHSHPPGVMHCCQCFLCRIFRLGKVTENWVTAHFLFNLLVLGNIRRPPTTG